MITGNIREAQISDLPFVNPTIRMNIGDPLPDAYYESLERLLAAYQSHVFGRGYGVVLNAKKKSKEDKRII
ncbi:hypothetical protein K3495_g2979 [Podosphaera aphanis]|nr:hypothetical protein K3495_g2979 [Podosphaera aphanis]